MRTYLDRTEQAQDSKAAIIRPMPIALSLHNETSSCQRRDAWKKNRSLTAGGRHDDWHDIPSLMTRLESCRP
jgi:hypothetical protein